MKLLIEGYKYTDHSPETAVYTALKGSGIMDQVQLDSPEPVQVGYVGYLYNRECEDVVFCLPKVVLTGLKSKTAEGTEQRETVFGLSPEELVDFDTTAQRESKPIRDFLSELAIWLYRSITIYRDHYPDTDVLSSSVYNNDSRGRKASKLYTLFDVVLALRDFNKENQDFLTFVTRSNHSGANRIHWSKTISRTTAFVQDGTPIYMNPVSSKKEVNFDEELLIIYYSILHHIKSHYGFPLRINTNYPIITGDKFKAYCDNDKGRRRLKAIKYKYFSDKAVKLWNLCYAFFDQRHDISIRKCRHDYLLVHSYQVVFERMIDELLGDDGWEKGLKEQRDRKRVDHLFVYDSLIHADIDQRKYNTYYIGDSKYYSRKEMKDLGRDESEKDMHAARTGISLSDTDVYKQFTYARNVIQWNTNLFLGGGSDKHPQLRSDSLTEGYNVIPNFFISAYIPNEEEERRRFDFEHDYLQSTGAIEFNRHFDNRLFDRDTLLLSYYNINFLFVVSLYGRDNKSDQRSWRNQVHVRFRDKVQSELDQLYNFYVLRPRYEGWQEYLKLHFHELNGKIYRPCEDCDYIIMALLKQDGDKIEKLLREYQVKTEDVERQNEMAKGVLGDYFEISKEKTLQEIQSMDEEEKQPVQQKLAPSVLESKALIYVTLKEEHYAKEWDYVTLGMNVEAESFDIVNRFSEARYVIVTNQAGKEKPWLKMVYEVEGRAEVKSTLVDNTLAKHYQDYLPEEKKQKNPGIYLTYKVKPADEGLLQRLDRDRIETTKQEKEDRHSPRVVKMDEIVNEER